MVRANLRSVDLGDPPSFLSALVLGEKELAAYAGSGPINTDDRPYISFTDRRRRGTSGGLPVLKSLVEHLVVNPRPYLSADIPTEVFEALERRLAARRHTVLGTIALLEKDGERAAADFARAREIDPGERGALRGLKQTARTRYGSLISTSWLLSMGPATVCAVPEGHCTSMRSTVLAGPSPK